MSAALVILPMVWATAAAEAKPVNEVPEGCDAATERS